jgi:hypothetical protein
MIVVLPSVSRAYSIYLSFELFGCEQLGGGFAKDLHAEASVWVNRYGALYITCANLEPLRRNVKSVADSNGPVVIVTKEPYRVVFAVVFNMCVHLFSPCCDSDIAAVERTIPTEISVCKRYTGLMAKNLIKSTTLNSSDTPKRILAP